MPNTRYFGLSVIMEWDHSKLRISIRFCHSCNNTFNLMNHNFSGAISNSAIIASLIGIWGEFFVNEAYSQKNRTIFKRIVYRGYVKGRSYVVLCSQAPPLSRSYAVWKRSRDAPFLSFHSGDFIYLVSTSPILSPVPLLLLRLDMMLTKRSHGAVSSVVQHPRRFFYF